MSARSKLYGQLTLALIVLLSLLFGVGFYYTQKQEAKSYASDTAKQKNSVYFASANVNEVERVDTYMSVQDYEHFATCKVTQISEGDKFFCRDTVSGEKLKLSLYGIAAPRQSQAFGMQARQALADKILNKVVHYDQMFIDDYSRMVSIIYFKESNINLELVGEGFAHVDTRYNEDKRYLQAQDFAKQSLLGLWNKRNWDHDRPPVKPWEFGFTAVK